MKLQDLFMTGKFTMYISTYIPSHKKKERSQRVPRHVVTPILDLLFFRRCTSNKPSRRICAPRTTLP